MAQLFLTSVLEGPMPRGRRIAPPGLVQHIINRGNDRKTVFRKAADYLAFLRYMFEAQVEIPIRILAFCLMPNHFHIVVWPECVEVLSAFMHVLMNEHVHRYQQHYGTVGHGHIWQGRFKNFPIQHDLHLLRVLRYVEANAARANLVGRAQEWSWSSLASPCDRSWPVLTPSPVPRPEDWIDHVNTYVAGQELRRIRQSVRRGMPYGEREWTARVAKEYGLEYTLRRHGRPRKEDADSDALIVLGV